MKQFFFLLRTKQNKMHPAHLLLWKFSKNFTEKLEHMVGKTFIKQIGEPLSQK